MTGETTASFGRTGGGADRPVVAPGESTIGVGGMPEVGALEPEIVAVAPDQPVEIRPGTVTPERAGGERATAEQLELANFRQQVDALRTGADGGDVRARLRLLEGLEGRTLPGTPLYDEKISLVEGQPSEDVSPGEYVRNAIARVRAEIRRGETP